MNHVSQEIFYRQHALASLECYWPGKSEIISSLPLAEAEMTVAAECPEYVLVDLPEWAVQCGVDDALSFKRVSL